MTFTSLEGEMIWTLDDFLSPEECADELRRAEAQGFTEAPITTGLGPVRMPSVRNNRRVMQDDPARADALWARLEPYAPRIPFATAVGLNERLRTYRYDPGQYFRRHLDGAYSRSARERSLYSVLIYLNGDFEGGETAFGGLKVTPRPGMLLAFRHRIRHEGRAVVRGRKYVLRTDLMYQLGT